MQADFQIVDRVECPTCYQRTFVALDCVCCGGIGFVDTDNIQPIIEATLIDLESGKARASENNWMPVGIYPLRDGTWFIIDQIRNTRRITEQDANAILFVDEPFWVDTLMTHIQTIASKVFKRIVSLILKPIL